MISPPAWGWPAIEDVSKKLKADFPTCVGMARNHKSRRDSSVGFPHLRGDVPAWRMFASFARMISPPAWGWPDVPAKAGDIVIDFPTCVGMARS